MSTRAITIEFMGERLSKKQREIFMDIAVRKNHWKKAAIARAIGTSPQNIDHMMNREGTRSNYLPALDAWLIANHDKPATPIETADDVDDDGLKDVIREIRNLLETLESKSLTEEFKQSRLKSFVRDIITVGWLTHDN